MDERTCVVSGGGESSVVALATFSGSEIALHSMMSGKFIRNTLLKKAQEPCTSFHVRIHLICADVKCFALSELRKVHEECGA